MKNYLATSPKKQALLHSLAFLQDIGVDEYITPQENSWYKLQQIQPDLQTILPKTAGEQLKAKPEISHQDIPSFTSLPNNLPQLYEKWQEIDCPLKRTSIHFVQPHGITNAEFMIIADFPTEEEDKNGHAFCATKGKLLDQILHFMKTGKESCYFSHLLPWRPPGNRTPQLQEIKQCLPFLLQEIELIAPKQILLMGGVVAKYLLGKEEQPMDLIGQIFSYSEKKIPTLVVYNPSMMMTTPHYKKITMMHLAKYLANNKN